MQSFTMVVPTALPLTHSARQSRGVFRIWAGLAAFSILAGTILGFAL